jgi:hypothetical protein
MSIGDHRANRAKPQPGRDVGRQGRANVERQQLCDLDR